MSHFALIAFTSRQTIQTNSEASSTHSPEKKPSLQTPEKTSQVAKENLQAQLQISTASPQNFSAFYQNITHKFTKDSKP